jgi:hypothetical protein
VRARNVSVVSRTVSRPPAGSVTRTRTPGVASATCATNIRAGLGATDVRSVRVTPCQGRLVVDV